MLHSQRPPDASRRRARFGKAIDAWPEDTRVAVIGSGGLWHTPGAEDAYVDEEFDRTVLDALRKGEADRMADYFDRWRPQPALKHLRCYESFSGGTHMSGGVGSGAGEHAQLDHGGRYRRPAGHGCRLCAGLCFPLRHGLRPLGSTMNETHDGIGEHVRRLRRLDCCAVSDALDQIRCRRRGRADCSIDREQADLPAGWSR